MSESHSAVIVITPPTPTCLRLVGLKTVILGIVNFNPQTQIEFDPPPPNS